jgi:hypothetical protein
MAPSTRGHRGPVATDSPTQGLRPRRCCIAVQYCSFSVCDTTTATNVNADKVGADSELYPSVQPFPLGEHWMAPRWYVSSISRVDKTYVRVRIVLAPHLNLVGSVAVFRGTRVMRSTAYLTELERADRAGAVAPLAVSTPYTLLQPPPSMRTARHTRRRTRVLQYSHGRSKE